MAAQPKLNLYKFVSIPSGKKNVGGASLVKAFNNIGATLNSSVIITKQLYEAVLKNTQDRIKQEERNQRRLQRGRDAASEAKQEGTGRSGAASAVKNFFSAETPNFFRGIANLATFFLRAFVIKNVLDWLGNPANREKIVKLVEGIGKLLKFLWEWAKSGVFNTLDGLSKMFGDGSWIQKLVGFGQFVAGLATLFFGIRWLKNPLKLVTDFKFVLTTLWRGLTGAKARLIARAGLSLARNPIVLATAAVAGTAYLANKVTGQQEGAQVQTENAAKVQQGKALPVPGVGGVGDVAPKPMVEGAAEGGIKQQGSPMKPLSALPSMMKRGKGSSGSAAAPKGGGGPNGSMMINKISQAMMLPFKVIGAGLLAAMAGSVALMGPFGKMLMPMISSLMGPIAGYFGLPEALVKSIAAKGGKFNLGKMGDNLEKLFGKSRKTNKKNTSKDYKPSGDTTVLGLLSDILGAIVFISGKAGGSSSGTPPPPPPVKDNNKNLGMKAGTAKLPTTVKAGDDKVQALEGTIGDLKSKGYNYVPGTNNQFFTDAQGRAYRSQRSGSTGVGIQGLFGQDKFTLSAANQEEIDTYNRIVDKKEKPTRAVGGWITGPMTGYPVSLDGGNSVSFIGHGKEWVGGFAKGGQAGNAFVIPYDTPATRKDPSLTSKRYSQARALGATLPSKSDKSMKFASGDVRPPLAKMAEGGILEGCKKTAGYLKGVGNGCAMSVRKALENAGHPAAGQTTAKGDLDSPPGNAYTKNRNAAGSFAGSDMGAVIRSAGSLAAGDVVLWKGGNGYGDGEITHVGIKGEGSELWHHGTAQGFRKASMYTNYDTGSGVQKFAFGIRLGGSGNVGGADGEGGDDAMSLESALDMIRKGQQAVFDTYGVKAPTAPTDAAGATNSRDKAKLEAKDKARNDRTRLNPPPVTGKAKNAPAAASAAATPPPPVYSAPSDVYTYAPTLSLFQINW